ncbi:hypothetical protein KNP414_02545 [Paenibacillus mucilaginosus KNP414]|uniref:Uncharacterized protein n=1 Tax=Paenibacillus mucilaginosus (strain KNP414) TaxID=1036673 RepID=F8FAL7_PAEMK|nr:hypothetical protein KNP414_02545 [Paenibacillus mucilaginosus KNP414]
MELGGGGSGRGKNGKDRVSFLLKVRFDPELLEYAAFISFMQ